VTEEIQRGYNTNLASEFFVLSALYRLGLSANLTLGNKKGVDIVVASAPGKAFTIEVKGVAGKHDWLVGSLGSAPRAHHFVVLVCYEGLFSNPDEPASIWIFRHEDIVPLVRSAKTGTAHFIRRREVRDSCEVNKNAWQLLVDAAN
jgi:hypothetical protein